MVPGLPLLRSRSRLARSSTGVGVGLALGVLEEVSPGELDDDGLELGSLLGWEEALALGSLLGVAEGVELGSLLGCEEGFELGSLLGVADGFGLGEGFCSGGGGTSQASAAFIAASVCSITAARLPLSWAWAARVRWATYRLVRTMHSGEPASFTLVSGSTLALGASLRAWLRVVTAEVGSFAAS